MSNPNTQTPYTDRILDTRTSGQIVRSMERIIASPEYAAERDAFYAQVNERCAAERAKQEALWAKETNNADQ